MISFLNSFPYKGANTVLTFNIPGAEIGLKTSECIKKPEWRLIISFVRDMYNYTDTVKTLKTHNRRGRHKVLIGVINNETIYIYNEDES